MRVVMPPPLRMAQTRVAIFASLGLASLSTHGCFFDVEDEAIASATSSSDAGSAGGAGAEGGSSSSASTGVAGEGSGAAGGAGASGSGGTGGAFVPPCSQPGSSCDCPAGLQCVNNCCEIPAPPQYCVEAIDVTVGGWFHANWCGGPPPVDVGCGNDLSLYLEVGKSPQGGGFDIVPEYQGSILMGKECARGGFCSGNYPSFHVEDDKMFSLHISGPDACIPSGVLAFEVIPL